MVTIAQLIMEPWLSLRLMCEIIRRPHSFRLAWIALNRWRAIQNPPEFSSLIHIVSSQQNPAVMEIRIRHGSTLYAWCQLVTADAMIISVNFHPKTADATMTLRFQKFMRARQDLTCLRQDSHALETLTAVKDALGEKRLSFLFIDGDHSYEGVKQDYELYSLLVAETGLIPLHDFRDNPKHPNYGVPRFWNESKESTGSAGGFQNKPQRGMKCLAS